ncbi:MAG: hypothetical protein J3R72DRAFT_447333 [Linnemannia gamsii]|nr:MAG: hypothetical protein J3R72DRAFT_447333 [Linnemannia gamsii]
MQDKRIIVLVSLALLIASTLADVESQEETQEKALAKARAKAREKWVRSGIDDCNGDPKCLNELVSYGGWELSDLFSENQLSPVIIFFRNQPYEDSFCEYIPPVDESLESLCPDYF